MQLSPNIAFMHIPKTAGNSVIAAFVERLGVEACSSFSPTINSSHFANKRFVSGHVYIEDITKDAFIFTFLRDPVKQLVSHLLWIDHYNLPEYEHETAHFPPSVVSGIRALKGKDLSCAKDLDRYLAALPTESELRIRNLQAELMSFSRGKVALVGDKKLAQMAIGNLNRLGFVGLSEDLGGEMPRLFRTLDLGDPPTVKRLNGALATQSIDISIPGVRRVLESYVQADLRLHEAVVRRNRSPTWKERLFGL